MVTSQLGGCVHHVERDDDGHDASLSIAHGYVLCGSEPAAKRRSCNSPFCGSLSDFADCIQRGGNRGAMGASVARLAISDDRE
jgi:hypothetical protein